MRNGLAFLMEAIIAPGPEDEYFEVILGSSRAVVDYVMGGQIKALQETKNKLDYSNQLQNARIHRGTQGIIKPEQIRLMLNQAEGRK